jgi:hypothetical protein
VGRTFAKFETLHTIYSHTNNMYPLLWKLNVTHNGGEMGLVFNNIILFFKNMTFGYYLNPCGVKLVFSWLKWFLYIYKIWQKKKEKWSLIM